MRMLRRFVFGLEELREKYESEKKDLENKNLLLKNAHVEREAHWIKLIGLLTFFVLLIFLVMVLLLVKNNRLLRDEKRKVDQQAAEIRHQHGELVQADRFRSSLFSVVSHDLRSPMATFQTLLAVSKIVDLPTNEIKGVLLSIGYQVEVAAKMLDDLLIWSSQQMADEKLDIQTVYPMQVVEECQQLFADRIHLKKLNVLIDIPSELTIQTDLKRFEFIVRNIFSNAIKFSLSGKSVVIGQRESSEGIIISIRDEGLGMDETTIRSLQDKGFQKSFEGTFHEKGTGIGLLLCHEFAKRINCTISIESTIGFGSTFYIQIQKNE